MCSPLSPDATGQDSTALASLMTFKAALTTTQAGSHRFRNRALPLYLSTANNQFGTYVTLSVLVADKILQNEVWIRGRLENLTRKGRPSPSSR